MPRWNRFKSWAQRVEKALLRLTIGACVLLVIAQAFLTNDDARRLMSYVDRLEGTSLTAAFDKGPTSQAAASRARQPVVPLAGAPTVTLRLVGRRSARLAVVLVDGRPAAAFTAGEVVVKVDDGDLIEIDGADYREELRVTVSAVDGGVIEPAPGTTVTTKRSIAIVGRVKTGEP